MKASRDVKIATDCIDTAFISFQKLKETLKLKIEWVQTTNQHLEFDQQINTLRIFRFPFQHKEDPLLARLYEENRRESSVEDGSSYFKIHPIEVLLVEILTSYHLIFGRNWRSRKSIGDIFDKQRLSWKKTGCRDTLLELLCSKDRQCLEIQNLRRA